MSANCESCGRPFGMARKRVVTATGREVCTGCRDQATAAAAGALANPDQPVVGAISTAGRLERLRRRRRRRS